jgi:short subunit dehydrogenase/CHAD domain-containing protein
MNKRSAARSFAGNAEDAAAQGRSIQAKIDRLEAKRKKTASEAQMQAGQRDYPSQFPAQHMKKPGLEAELKLQPMYEAPAYLGSEKLKGCAALITGGDSGIGRAVAMLYAREGADIAIVYLDEHEDGEETKQAVEAEGRRCIIMSGDVADPEFCREAVRKAVKTFGKLDILVNNAAFQELASFEDLTEEHFDRTLRACLYQFVANGAALRHGDLEAVHQMRVGMRRLRAAISVFKDMLAGPQTEAMKAEFKWITKSSVRRASSMYS